MFVCSYMNSQQKSLFQMAAAMCQAAFNHSFYSDHNEKMLFNPFPVIFTKNRKNP